MLVPAPGENIADTIGLVAKAYDKTMPLEFVRHLNDNDIYMRDKSMFVLPGIWTTMPADLIAAVRMRRTTCVTGRCPSCDACLESATGTIRHERWCSVSDSTLIPALRRWHRQVGKYARGKRIQEIPG